MEKSVLNCVEMLGGKGRIDIFECAHRDPNVPLKETLGTVAELVDASKIWRGGIERGQCEDDQRGGQDYVGFGLQY